jgi:HPt (histidine-containing phosphotransfer) domain-containing protein
VLIYNHNKEFVGIDSDSLKLLGFSTFNELLAEHRDIANLFIKKPGYIHNFKNFPWIDFILHADAEESKAIIQGRNRAFSCQLDITPLYLNDAPEKEAYLIRFKHVQDVKLSEEELAQASIPEPIEPPAEEPLYAPEPAQAEPVAAEAPSFETPEPAEEEAPSPEAVEPTPLEDIHLDVFAESEEESSAPVYHEPEPFPEEAAPEAEIPSHEPEAPTVPEAPEAPAQRPMLGDYINKEEQAFIDNLQTDKDYVYDPHVASDELGLPVDLIEEFIGDFIKQAHEFRSDMFSAAQSEDFDNVKILSHKLKGVAANLRIEDAFEVLTIINESNDSVEVEANLKQLFNIIAKLEGKEMPEYGMPEAQPAEPAPVIAAAEEEETYVLEPKFEEPEPAAPAAEEEELYTLEPKFEEPPAPIPETAPAAEAPETEELYAFDFDLEPEMPQTGAGEEEKQPETETAAAPKEEEPYDFDFNRDVETPQIEEEEQQPEVSPEIEAFATPSEVPVPTETEEASTVEPPKPFHYNVDDVALELGLNSGLVKALIQDYIEEAEEMKQMFDDSLAASEAQRWQDLAIKLKGVSDNLRMNEVSLTLQKLVTTNDTAEARNAVDEFYGYINQLS